MSARILILLGHPRIASFCGALADQYAAGAVQAGAEVRRIAIATLEFDAVGDVDYVAANPAAVDRSAPDHPRPGPGAGPTGQPVGVPESGGPEPAVTESMELIRWADRIVWVYPLWWGFMPALLKGYIDRVLAQPDFASTYGKYGMPVGLLAPRRSSLIVTMDAPVYWEGLVKRNRGIGIMKHSILKLCGITVDRTLRIGGMFDSTPAMRQRALARAEEAGRKDAER